MLRWRLLVGLVSVFVLLLAAGSYSIWLITRLESDIDSILRDNYESIRAAHNLRLAMLRMNVAYLKPTVAETVSAGLEPLEEVHLPLLERTTITLRLLASSPDEKKTAQKLTAQLADYVARFRRILSLRPDDQAGYQSLRSQLSALNLSIADTTEQILADNEQQMLGAQKSAQAAALDTVRFLVGAMIAAVGVFLYTYFMLGRQLVSPIEHLTRSIDAVRARQFEQSLPVKSNDELGQLARTFNAMAAELLAYRRDTDETILRLNRSLREAIAAFPYPVMLLDADFAVWVTNEAAEEFLKSSGRDNDLPDSIREHLDAVRRTGTDYLPEGPHEAMLFRKDGREVHYLPRLLRIFTPEDDLAGVAVILIDVTRFRWLDDMKTNLISTISHEIKTPLTGIRMILHLLLEKSSGDLTKTQDEMVRAACGDCERLLATLNNLLDLSRLEAGRAQLELLAVAPAALLEEARAAFQVQAADRGITLSVECGGGQLPAVLVDRSRIMHVLGNFLSNALKFAPAHSAVRLFAEVTGEEFVRFSITDSGPGIPEQYRSRIFDKFFRGPGQRAEGIGLGLSIAREIVHAHDGRVSVESIPNVATSFICELPVAAA